MSTNRKTRRKLIGATENKTAEVFLVPVVTATAPSLETTPPVPTPKASVSVPHSKSTKKKPQKPAAPPKKASSKKLKDADIEVEDDSGDHTSDLELDTDEDSAGSLVNFIVDDDSSVDVENEDTKSSEEEAKGEIIESAVYENGVRRSTRNKKPVERYVDSDYEELMCADADPEIALESTEAEAEEETDHVEEEEEELESTEVDTESDD